LLHLDEIEATPSPTLLLDVLGFRSGGAFFQAGSLLARCIAGPVGASDRNRLGIAVKTQVAVEVSSVIRASPDSFRMAWMERRYENGQLAATERWSAILTVVIQPPRDVDRLRKNPLGIYVNAINWSKELGQ